MQNIRQYLKNNLLITDGAMGTYLSSLRGRSAVACETFNLLNPGLVERVHREYVKSGSRLILTNTFCANTGSLDGGWDRVEKILRAGVRIAGRAAEGRAYVAGDIGPIREDAFEDPQVMGEYYRIADTFLSEGVRIFVLETFSEAENPCGLAAYLRKQAPDCFILISFTVTPDGFSRLGNRADALITDVVKQGAADAAGFNCCSGPAHLMALASGIDFGNLIPSLMPNAGYPEREDGRLVYAGAPDYFGEKLAEAAGKGFRILGGCCGTTPEHIRQLTRFAGGFRPAEMPGTPSGERKTASGAVAGPGLESRKGNKKTVVIELDPPFDSDLGKLEDAARAAAMAGADALTIADSPMARPRADSVIVAARLRRFTGVETIPHICCRDKNVNALKSALIGAHMEGIRNILAVTGDPVSETDRSFVKSVFNFNSAGLCGFIRDLNRDIFKEDPIHCGCAFNVNARNIEEELKKLQKKLQAGASFVLTQPVFTEESAQALRRATGLCEWIFAGILTPLSYRNARFLANEIPGILLPREMIGRFSPEMTREEGEEAGIRLSAETIRKIAPFVRGFYFMTPFNRTGVTIRLMEKLRREGIL